MKTTTEVALERVAKAVEQMTRTMNDLTKVLEKQNQILLSVFQAVPTYRDVEEDRPDKAAKVFIR